MQPLPVKSPPNVATQRGPMRSCSRPAGIIASANTMHATEYGSALLALLHAHESGMPPLITLQA